MAELRAMWLLLVLSVLVLLTLCKTQPHCETFDQDFHNDSESLYILVLAPFPSPCHEEPIFNKGHSLVPAVDLALEHINNSPSVLPGRRLGRILGDSACQVGTEVSLPLFSHVLNATRPVLGIVGPSCTEASLYLANITKNNQFSILQAMMATSDVLEDHSLYQHTFGMVSSFNVLVDHVMQMARGRGWTRMAVLTDQSREFFLRTFNSFISQAALNNITVESQPVATPHFLQRPLREIQNNHSSRVIFAIMSADTAKHVACLAGLMGMTSPQYQFIYADRSLGGFTENSNFSFTDQEAVNCSEELIVKGLNGAILLSYGLDSLPNNTVLTNTNSTVAQVKSEYLERLRQYGDDIGEELPVSTYAYPYYDGTWALALAIHKALEELGNFSASNERFFNNTPETQLLRNKFAALSFQGVSVRVEFDNETAHVVNKVDVFQVAVEDGAAVLSSGNLSLIDDIFKRQHVSLHPALVAVGLVLSLLALVLTLTLHAITIRHREEPSVKASSPRLNHFIFASCYLLLLTVLIDTAHYGFLTAPSQEIVATILCNVNEFIFPVCLSLIINTVFVKLWRLYSIFNRAFKRQVLVFDRQLGLVVVAMELAVLLLSVPWLVAGRYKLKESERFDNQEMVLVVEHFCRTVSPLISLPYFFVLLFATLSFALAYLNRKIRQNEYRSKETIIFTYLFCVLLGVIGIIRVVASLAELGSWLAYVLGLTESLWCVLLCNLVLFLPPCYPLIKRHLYHQEIKRSFSNNSFISNKSALKRFSTAYF